jgi:S-adenosylmethionine:tRNA ribosyltransferase-isomerase
MQRTDFNYYLPPHLIAQQPNRYRASSRLLWVNSPPEPFQNRRFIDLPHLLSPGDLLIFNDTRVIPARLLGRKSSGGKIEILVERLLDNNQILAQIRASQPPPAGMWLYLNGGVAIQVLQRIDNFFQLQFDDPRSVEEILHAIGQIPLPPYIRRAPTELDSIRYQTVYARQPGAVAAPTAGLHFDQSMLTQLQTRGIEMAFITLHVGAGTFAPVRVEDIHQHVMHSEYMQVSPQVCEQIRTTKARGGRIIAVGTTCVRAVEAASVDGNIQPYSGETRLFITPGYRFQNVDALLTNFHLPQSTLLMLVCAFAGKDWVLAAYRHAVEHEYRFFSYGDAMLVSHNSNG